MKKKTKQIIKKAEKLKKKIQPELLKKNQNKFFFIWATEKKIRKFLFYPKALKRKLEILF